MLIKDMGGSYTILCCDIEREDFIHNCLLSGQKTQEKQKWKGWTYFIVKEVLAWVTVQKRDLPGFKLSHKPNLHHNL